MSITRHKILSWALGLLSFALLIGLLVTLLRLNLLSHQVRYAQDMVERFNNERDLAMKGELGEAVDFLQKWHFPRGMPSPFTGSLSDFVETQRRRAIRDVIGYLRAKADKDLGDTPEPWLREYATQ